MSADDRELRILLVEDSPDDELLIARALRNLSRPVEHQRVEAADALDAKLAGDGWDLVISDYVLPGSFSGLAVIRQVRQRDPDLPIIIVSGTIGEDVAVEAVRTGADDYVMKSNLDRLAYAVERALRDRRERRQRELERQGLEAQLQEALRMEALGRLAGGIAHDFNNLLTAINGYADLLAMELPPGSPQREEALEIRRAGTRGAELVQQLLAFGRRQALRPEPLDLAEVLTELRPLLRRLVTEAVEVHLEIGSDTPAVLVDRNQFEQAMVNLVANARDAMPEGGAVRIRTAAAIGGGGGKEALVEVIDTGEGIDPTIRPMLFTPFFTTKAPGKGTGLGLPSVHGFVSQSGGAIEVGSGPEGGARFTLRLPSTSEPVTHGPEPAAEAPGPGAGELVLLVEDDDTVRSLATIILERHGFRVVAAGRPADVDAVLGRVEEPPTVLVTDVVMPGGDGRSLAAALRRRMPGLGVVLMSGYAPELEPAGDEPVHGEGLETAQSLAKPFVPSELIAAVHRAIDAVR